MLRRFAAHTFSEEGVPFCPKTYSRMKFGCDESARQMGEDLALKFKAQINNVRDFSSTCILMSSPYNVVPNAASIMAEHFMHYTNEYLCETHRPPLQVSHIHRSQTYTADYGKMQHEERVRMLASDSFSINRDFTRGKTLVIVDDVRITGTHEKRLEDEFREHFVDNNRWYLYYANCENVKDASVEAALNFSEIKNIFDLAAAVSVGKWHVLIRPLKMILSSSTDELKQALSRFDPQYLQQVVYNSYAESYHLNPKFSASLNVIKQFLQQL